jgi:lipopolysaccharide biosynthesis protein
LRYKQWLSSVTNKVFSNKKYADGEKFVFINAWNEWAEGTHLEPDQKFGFGYLQTTYDVLQNYDSKAALPQLRQAPPVRQHDQAVILHLHYTELWNDIRDQLQAAVGPHGFDLYVTVTSGEAMLAVLRDFPAAHVELVENRGRDILPFIRLLKLISTMGYLAVCKIHSKRSVYRGDGDAIRDEIFEALLGSEQHVGATLSRFKSNEQLGMLVPQKYLVPHTDHNMTFDHEVVGRASRHMGMNFEYGVFPAGSMFWFSPHSLTPLLEVEDGFFEIESGLADGTTAHAIERLFCHIVSYSDYLIEGC